MKLSGHCLIVGTTMAGKTTLAKGIARHFSQRNVPVLVLTTFAGDPWPADLVTDDETAFMDAVFSHTGCLVIVDEAGEYAGRFDKTMFKLATRGRHNGHICIFIAQRAKMVNVNIRANCNNLFLFRSSPNDCRLLEEDFVCGDLSRATKLNVGECLSYMGTGNPRLVNVFGGG